MVYPQPQEGSATTMPRLSSNSMRSTTHSNTPTPPPQHEPYGISRKVPMGKQFSETLLMKVVPISVMMSTVAFPGLPGSESFRTGSIRSNSSDPVPTVSLYRNLSEKAKKTWIAMIDIFCFQFFQCLFRL